MGFLDRRVEGQGVWEGGGVLKYSQTKFMQIHLNPKMINTKAVT